MATTTSNTATYDGQGPSARGGIVGRQLAHYPSNGRRSLYLAIVVLATIVMYYELYVGGAASTRLAVDLHMSFYYLVAASIIGNGVGALGSLAAGLADRLGRANITVYGLGVTGLLTAFAFPEVTNRTQYIVLAALLGLVEGAMLVTTPALIRDFTPQLGRASAMGFWTLGPILGSLVVTEVASHTLSAHPDPLFQYRICGIVGLVVFAIAFVGLRELAPRLRDQLMISLRDRALVEARARSIDPKAVLAGHWRQMMRLDIVASATAISLYLLFYFFTIGFFVIYFALNFGYSTARANALANWYWAIEAVTLVVAGALSDLLKVRKPFMVLGGVISTVGVVLFAVAATHHDTTYHQFIGILALVSIGGGLAFSSWMAAFTETVERRNPAATATGLAVWGSILRVVACLSAVVVLILVPSANTLIGQGPKLQALAAKYSTQLTTLQKIDPATQAALGRNPGDTAAQARAVSEISGVSVVDVAKAATLSQTYAQQLATAQAVDLGTLLSLSKNPADAAAGRTAVGEIAAKLHVDAATATTRLQALGAVPTADLTFLLTTGPSVQASATQLRAASKIPASDLAYLQKNAAKVQAAEKSSPHQWQHYLWITLACQLVFLPVIGLMAGRWRPSAARRDADAHAAAIERELENLAAGAL